MSLLAGPHVSTQNSSMSDDLTFTTKENEEVDKKLVPKDDDGTKDNPKLAIMYFVFYTMFSTYNLIAGKFFRTWYPHMSTF